MRGEHDGYYNRYGLMHQRCYTFSAENQEIVIFDSIEKNELSYITFTLSTSVNCIPIDGQTWLLKTNKVTLRLKSTIHLELTSGSVLSRL